MGFASVDPDFDFRDRTQRYTALRACLDKISEIGPYLKIRMIRLNNNHSREYIAQILAKEGL